MLVIIARLSFGHIDTAAKINSMYLHIFQVTSNNAQLYKGTLHSCARRKLQVNYANKL